MTYYCHRCGEQLAGQRRKWCGKECQWRHRYEAGRGKHTRGTIWGGGWMGKLPQELLYPTRNALRKMPRGRAKRREIDNRPHRKLVKAIQRRTRNAIKSGNYAGNAYRPDGHLDTLGCTPKQLVKYIEDQFSGDMTWDNYGHPRTGGIWGLDHIIPLSQFDLSDKEQYLRAHHYTNLQPMLNSENFSKKAKIEDPQLHLPLAP